jgi:hypothetical protein
MPQTASVPDLVHEVVHEDLDDALRTDVLRKADFEVREPRM